MPERYAWLTFACVLCVLNVSWCRAADDDEHVHIKVRMPELARKHKTHKSPQQHHHHNYHHLPRQHHHYYKITHPNHQYTNPAAKHGRRAVKPTAPVPPPPLPPASQLSGMMPHNHHDMGFYGGEMGAGVGGVGMASSNGLRGGLSDQLLYSPGTPRPIPLAPDLASNYGPALFGIGNGGGGGTAPDGSSGANNQQDYAAGAPASTSVLTMPGSTQQLMQHMELMGALAAAAAAAAGGGGGEGDGDEGAAAGVGGGASETMNTLLADDFLAEMQRTYANGKFPATNSKRKKKYRGGGLAEIGDAAAVTFPLNTPQLHQQQQHQQLLRQQYQQQQQQQQQRQQQFYGVNYFTQQPKPQAHMLRAPANYHSSYHQHKHYKNKHHYNNNDIYATATTDDGIDNDSSDGDDRDDGDEDDNDNDDDATLYFSGRPASHTSTHSTAVAYNDANDYEDIAHDEEQQFGYNSNSNSNNHYNNNYFDGVDGDANEGVNPVSYQTTTAYGAYAASASTPAAVTHLKLRPYRQLPQQRKQKHQYMQQQHNTSLQPSGVPGHQQLQLQPPQQQLITTAQPINVVGPTASDFNEHPPPPAQQQQHRKYPVSPRYKKRKNRIKGKPNRNRIPTQ